MGTTIYLDHAAATPMHPEALARMLPYMTEQYGNPSSIHSYGRDALAAVTEARETLGAALNVSGRRILFTSGGTESDNLAILGLAARNQNAGHVITTGTEHHAVLHACERLEQLGVQVTYLPVDKTGRVNPEEVRRAIRPDTFLITIMLANNETGTLQPIEEIGAIAQEAGVLFHTDAVQAFGTVPLDMRRLPVDLMSLSSHKIGGPKGVGALYVGDKVLLQPLLYGGTQERNRRAGTENVPGIVGFGAAAALTASRLAEKRAYLESLRELLLGELSRLLPTGAFLINGHETERLPHILNVSFPGVSAETLLMNLDLASVCAASGSACTSGSLEPSHVLTAMGMDKSCVSSAIRFSFAPVTTKEEIVRAAEIVATFVCR
ncbi:cysteine desulfurase family protein [Gorillibacterium timonense]|uniref:cysteine desulfurase family protein n=1 Tax=Gorillibacterium timonense TaxID=1689269 RepID=UPI00071E4225|nr:cysteine desulfurase family protein [Gorillibacterium timonense]